MRNASKFNRLAGLILGTRLGCQRSKFSRCGIRFNLRIPDGFVKLKEPAPEFGEISGGMFLHSLLNGVNGAHVCLCLSQCSVKHT